MIMRHLLKLLLTILAVLSVWYLSIYVRTVVQFWILNEAIELERLDEVSIWFYRERGEDGLPSSPYRMGLGLSIVDPLDGPNWEVRIPGWIPAIFALGVLASFVMAISANRRRDSGTDDHAL